MSPATFISNCNSETILANFQFVQKQYVKEWGIYAWEIHEIHSKVAIENPWEAKQI